MKIAFHTIIPFISVLVGLGILLLTSFQMWTPILIFLGTTLVFSLFYAFRRRPEVLILLFLIACFMPIDTRVSYGFFLLTIIFLLIKRYFAKRTILKFDIVIISWLILFLLGLISIRKWTHFNLGPLWFMALVIIPMSLYIIIKEDYIQKEGIEWLLSKGVPYFSFYIVIATLIAVFVVLLQQDYFFYVFDITIFRKLMIPGTPSNRLADVLIFIAVFGFVGKKYWMGTGFKNILMIVMIVTALALSLLTVSRGALVGLFAALATYVFSQFINKKRLNLWPIISILLTMAFIMKPFVEKMIFRLQTVKVDYSTLIRLSIWRDSILRIKNGLFLGTGPGQYAYRAVTETHDDPHNMFLRYGVEFGGIGMLLIFCILIYPFVLYLQNKHKLTKEARTDFYIFLIPMIGTLVHSQMDYIITSRGYGPFIWLLWAIWVKKLIGYKQPLTVVPQRNVRLDGDSI